mmetsp:Transcript_51494/g.159722  ORF Transcript_51494/g.159722 Transcript_51494/m.159722 type:complete len:478 (-) Transcript_51494:16-1449(-)
MTMGRLGRSRALVPELGERHGVYPLAGFKVRTLSGRGLDGLERLIFCCLAFTSCPRFCCNSKFSFKSCVQDCRMSTVCVGETSALAMACDNLLLLLSRSGPAVVGLQGAGGSSFSWATNLSLELLACVMDRLWAGALSCAAASVVPWTASVSDFKGVEAGTAAPKIVSTRNRSFRIMSSASSRRPCITAALSVMLLSTEDSRSRRVLCNSAEKDSSQASLSDRSHSSCASMRFARSSKVFLDLLDSSSCENIRCARSHKAGASSVSWSGSCCCCCSRDVTPRSCSSRDWIRCNTAFDSVSTPVEDLASELSATLGTPPLPKGAAGTGAVAASGARPGAGGACCADPGQEDSDGGDMPARTDGGNAAAGHGTVTTLVRGLRPPRDVRAEGAPILACGTRSRTDSLASVLGKDEPLVGTAAEPVILRLQSVLGPCGPAPTHTAAPPKIAYLGMPPSLVLRRSMRSRDARGGPSPRAHEA